MASVLRRVVCGAALIAVLPFAASCEEVRGASSETPAKEEVREAPSKTSPKDDGAVVARVNDAVLTVGDLERQFENLPRGASMKPEQLQSMKKRSVEQWIQIQLVYQEAVKKGLDKDPKIVNQVEEMAQQIIARAYVTEAMKSAEPSEKEIADYYENNQERFKTPETFTLLQIVVEKEEGAKQVLEQLAAGKEFEQLVKEVSVDKTSAGRGGAVGNLQRVLIERRFGADAAKAVAQLEKGGVSKPIRGVDNKYHIFKLTDHAKAGLRPLEEAKKMISDALVREKQAESFQKLIDTLKENATVEEYQELL